jgi:hypothetical protein
MPSPHSRHIPQIDVIVIDSDDLGVLHLLLQTEKYLENVLHWAAKSSGLEICSWLMQCGADPYERDEGAYNSLAYAIQANRILPICQLTLRCNSQAETFQKLHLPLRRGVSEFMPGI